MRFGKIACNGGTTTVTATVLSGATPYRYAWSNGFNQAVSASTVSNNVNVKAGIHKVTVTDRVGCVVVDSVIVTEPPLLVVAITQSDITTLNGSEGKIGFVITGGTLPYTRVLTLNGTAIPPTQTTPPQYNNLSKGIYAYTVTDANGCTKTGTIVLNESACLSGIEKANAGLDIIECNKTTSSLKANPIQNTIRVTGKWSVLRGTATISSPTTAQTAVANLSQGSNLFVWTLTDSICSFFSKDTVAIFVEPKPQLQNAYYSLNANARQMLINIQDILSKTMANPTAVQIFPHQISSNLGKVVVQNSQSILYTVENFVGGSTVEVPLKVCSQVCPNLCDSATLFITVNIIDNGIDLVIPQVFATDYSFALTLMEIGNLEWYPANQMTIVDRWGGTVFGPVVYKNKTAEQAWDGTKHGQRLPTGAYYYYITYLDNRILRIKRGIIYLIDKE
jgi:gliding motility-associated-like protein